MGGRGRGGRGGRGRGGGRRQRSASHPGLAGASFPPCTLLLRRSLLLLLAVGVVARHSSQLAGPGSRRGARGCCSALLCSALSPAPPPPPNLHLGTPSLRQPSQLTSHTPPATLLCSALSPATRSWHLGASSWHHPHQLAPTYSQLTGHPQLVAEAHLHLRCDVQGAPGVEQCWWVAGGATLQAVAGCCGSAGRGCRVEPGGGAVLLAQGQLEQEQHLHGTPSWRGGAGQSAAPQS